MTLFQTGFRPFFALAAAWAALVVSLQVAQVRGWLLLHPSIPAPLWHPHEMLYGFGGAVLAGFLLTAVRNWTGQPTAQGPALAALVALWGAGRALMLWPSGSLAWLELAFLPAVALAIGLPLVRTHKTRNYGFIGLLLGLAAADAVVHAAPQHAGWAWAVSLDALALFIAIMGGRIIPMFTRNGVGAQVQRVPWVDRLALGALWGLLGADLLGLGVVAGGVALVAALAHAWRLRTWGGQDTLRTPILWVLHLGYLGLCAGLLLLGLTRLGLPIPRGVASHTLAIAGFSMVALGMLSRVALGHTGRQIQAHPLITAAYVLIGTAALLRVSWAIWPVPGLLLAAASLFVLGWLLYLGVYLPILLAPRVDGRPG